MDRWADKVKRRARSLGEGVERVFGFWADHCIAIIVVLLCLCFVPGLETIAGFLLAMHILLPGVFVLFLFLFGLVAAGRYIIVDMLHLL